MRPATLVVFVVAALAIPSHAAAQAWTPPAGTGSVTVAVQEIENTGHRLADGATRPIGQSRNAAVYLEVGYALTDRWSVAAGLPYVFARYTAAPGDTGVGPPQPVDICRCWQHAWQDLGITTRFNLLRGQSALTPFVAIGVPSHGYVYRGEAVAGRDLAEARLGVAAGRRLDALTPRLSIEGTYSYAIVQRVMNIHNNRSNATIEAAFLAGRKLSLRGFVAWQHTHGGLRGGVGPPPPAGYPWGDILTEDLLTQHDRLLRDNNVHAGTGVAFPLSRADIFASYTHYISGVNTHAGHVLSGGVTWPFEWHPRRESPPVP